MTFARIQQQHDWAVRAGAVVCWLWVEHSRRGDDGHHAVPEATRQSALRGNRTIHAATGNMPELTLVPITLDEANEFVRQLHRHNDPVPGCKFCVGASRDDKIVGVAIAGRPIARMLDNGWTLEILRTCTDGTRNANEKRGKDWRTAAEHFVRACSWANRSSTPGSGGPSDGMGHEKNRA